MQYTIRRLPPVVDRALRKRARQEGRSLNAVAIDALAQGLGVVDVAVRRDLSDILAMRSPEPETLAVLADLRKLDPDMWK